jgi:hypothetical protein
MNYAIELCSLKNRMCRLLSFRFPRFRLASVVRASEDSVNVALVAPVFVDLLPEPTRLRVQRLAVFSVLPDIHLVGVMSDKRTYAHPQHPARRKVPRHDDR